MSAAGVCAELVAPVANMLAAAVAAGRLVSTTAGIPTRVASGVGDASVAGGTSAQATEVEAKEIEVKEVEVKEIEVKEVEVKEVEGERADEGTGHPLGPDHCSSAAGEHSDGSPSPQPHPPPAQLTSRARVRIRATGREVGDKRSVRGRSARAGAARGPRAPDARADPPPGRDGGVVRAGRPR